MSPSRRDHIVKLATAIAQHRGRTVAAITSFSARCLMSPALCGVQRANTGGRHDLISSNSNIRENVFLNGTASDLALSRSSVRTGAHIWDGRAEVAGDADGFAIERKPQ